MIWRRLSISPAPRQPGWRRTARVRRVLAAYLCSGAELCSLPAADELPGDGGRLTMTLIDLGDVGEAAKLAAAPVDLPRLRRLALAVLAVAGLLALAGSAAPAPSLVRPLWTAVFRTSDTMALDGRMVYLNRASPAGPSAVSAYDLPTGHLRWSTPTGAAVADYGVR